MEYKPNILIVEDEPLIAEDIAGPCRLNGYGVRGGPYRAAGALHLVGTSKPNLPLLDINLQDSVNGLEIAKALREKYAIPFIFLTSYSGKATLAKAKDATPLGYTVNTCLHFKGIDTQATASELSVSTNTVKLCFKKTLRSLMHITGWG